MDRGLWRGILGGEAAFPGKGPGLPVIEVVEWGIGTAKSPGSGESRITEHASVHRKGLTSAARSPCT